MSNINYSEYVKSYRASGLSWPTNVCNIMIVNKNKYITPPTDSKLSFRASGKVRRPFYENGRLLVNKIRTSFNNQSSPVINITSLYIKSNKTKIYSGLGYEFNTYILQSHNIMLIDTLYSKNVTQLTSDQVILKPFPKQGGVMDIQVTLVSGKHCEIALKGSEDAKVISIDNLPASLSFNDLTNSIEGIPFVTGKTTCNALLSNGLTVKVTINVIPLSLCSGI